MSETTSKLVFMANQIAIAFRAEGAEAASQATAEHIIQFWDPRMRDLILAHHAAGGSGLNDIAWEAVHRLERRQQAIS